MAADNKNEFPDFRISVGAGVHLCLTPDPECQEAPGVSFSREGNSTVVAGVSGFTGTLKLVVDDSSLSDKGALHASPNSGKAVSVSGDNNNGAVGRDGDSAAAKSSEDREFKEQHVKGAETEVQEEFEKHAVATEQELSYRSEAEESKRGQNGDPEAQTTASVNDRPQEERDQDSAQNEKGGNVGNDQSRRLPQVRVSEASYPSRSSGFSTHFEKDESDEEDEPEKKKHSLKSMVRRLIDEKKCATPLHAACSRDDVTVDELRAILDTNPEAAAMADANGKLPLHVLSSNHQLLGYRAGREHAGGFCKDLFAAYPEGIATRDSHGEIPFCDIIQEWIDRTYELRAPTETGPALFQITRALMGTSLPDSSSARVHIDRGSGAFEPSTSVWALHKSFPLVNIGPLVEWCFVLLSAALDHLGGPLPMIRKAREKMMNARAALANHVASIPLLLKTILLIDDEDTRYRMVNSSIFRRVLLSNESVGPWLLSMLRKHGTPSQRAVDYLVMVSSVSIEDFVGGARSPRSGDIRSYHEERSSVFEAIEDFHDMIPSLVVLPDKQIERASTTEIVWKILNKSIARPFVIGIILIDFVLHLSLMLSFRFDVVEVGHELQEPDSQDNPFGKNFPFVVSTSICVYFLLRKLGEGVSMMRISKRVFRRHVTDVWNLIDILAVVMTMVSNAWIRHGDIRSNFLAVTMGLLWLKLLGFMKAVNMQLATFTLAVVQIMKDIRWFLVVLLIGIFMFGDMIHIVTSTEDGGALCVDAEDAVADFCDSSIMKSYVRMYSVLIGDFELEQFQSSRTTIGLFVLFTFVGVIVLFNVLIAIVSDSYEKSKIGSKNLFGRARVGFASGCTSLENFLRPKPRHMLCEDFSLRRKDDWVRILDRLGRWIFLTCLIGIAIIADIYLVAVLAGKTHTSAGRVTPALLMALTVILCIILNVALTVVIQILLREFFLARSGTRTSRMARQVMEDTRGNRVMDVVDIFLKYVIRMVCERVFGIRERPTDSEEDLEEEWGGRLDYIEKMTRLIVNMAVEASETRIRDHETALNSELKTEMQRMCDEIRAQQ